MKRLLLFFILFLDASHMRAQDSLPDTTRMQIPVDTLRPARDTTLKTNIIKKDSAKLLVREQGDAREAGQPQFYFYIIIGLFLYLAILKAAFGKYFNNMIRVFFNTSLRQMQLTDQLLIAQLPSLLFNLFFLMVGGAYLFFMLHHFVPTTIPDHTLWLYSFAVVAGIYLVKYIAILFTGWVTGFSTDAGTYMFIVFLVNKILSIILLPLVALIAFATPLIAQWSIYASFVVVALAFVIRYLRTYGLMRDKHKMSFYHFLLYIFAIEVLPILLLFHFAMQFLRK